MLHAPCSMCRLASYLVALFCLAIPASAEVVVDDFTDGFFSQTISRPVGINLQQTELAGVMGGERTIIVGGYRADEEGSATVGVYERDGGFFGIDSEVYFEGTSISYPNVQIDLTDPQTSIVQVDINVLSVADDRRYGGGVVLVRVVDEQADLARGGFGHEFSQTGAQTLSLSVDDFLGTNVDFSRIDRLGLSILTNPGLSYEIQRVYLVPEPTLPGISFLVSGIYLVGLMRRRL
ncbi:hypothetical protein ACFL2H_05030 [Planctomycetota bacterium]